MEICWLRKLNEKSSLNHFVLTLYPDLGKLSMFGREFSNAVMQRINNLCWRNVSGHYKILYTKCSPTNVNEFMSECLHCNVNIKRGKRVVYVKDWFDAGNLFVY